MNCIKDIIYYTILKIHHNSYKKPWNFYHRFYYLCFAEFSHCIYSADNIRKDIKINDISDVFIEYNTNKDIRDFHPGIIASSIEKSIVVFKSSMPEHKDITDCSFFFNPIINQSIKWDVEHHKTLTKVFKGKFFKVYNKPFDVQLIKDNQDLEAFLKSFYAEIISNQKYRDMYVGGNVNYYIITPKGISKMRTIIIPPKYQWCKIK